MGQENFSKALEEGKPGEKVLINTLLRSISIEGWVTREIYHIPYDENDKRTGYLQARGGDVVEILEQLETGEGPSPVMKPTGKKRIIFHEVKTSYGTFGNYKKDAGGNRELAKKYVEQLVNKDGHKIKAGTGRVPIEFFGNKSKPSPALYEVLSKETDPFNSKDAGWYWKYKKAYETITANNEDIEFNNKVWFYLVQNDGKKKGENTPMVGRGTERLQIMVGMEIKNLIEKIDKIEILKEWDEIKREGGALLIPLRLLIEDMEVKDSVGVNDKEKGCNGFFFENGSIMMVVWKPFGHTLIPEDDGCQSVKISKDIDELWPMLAEYGIVPDDI